MTRQTTSAHSWPAIIALMLAALSLNVAAAPCDPDESKWVPSRYYPAGAVVHHDGEWYQSRELHEGLEPGITFDWKQLDSAPECSGEAASPARPTSPTQKPGNLLRQVRSLKARIHQPRNRPVTTNCASSPTSGCSQ